MQIFIDISLEVVMVVGIQVVVYWLVTWCSLVGGNTLLEECQSAFDPEDCSSWFPQDIGVHLQVDSIATQEITVWSCHWNSVCKGVI